MEIVDYSVDDLQLSHNYCILGTILLPQLSWKAVFPVFLQMKRKIDCSIMACKLFNWVFFFNAVE